MKEIGMTNQTTTRPPGPRIVAFTGLAGVGKTTLARSLTRLSHMTIPAWDTENITALERYQASDDMERYALLNRPLDFMRYSFAQPLKRFIMRARDYLQVPDGENGTLPLAQVLRQYDPEDAKRQVPGVRKLYQALGCLLRDEFGGDVHVQAFRPWMLDVTHREYEYDIVIDDARFPNELTMLQQQNALIVCLRRQAVTEQTQHQKATTGLHKSEDLAFEATCHPGSVDTIDITLDLSGRIEPAAIALSAVIREWALDWQAGKPRSEWRRTDYLDTFNRVLGFWR